MPMSNYIFNDARLAQELREAGFTVIGTMANRLGGFMILGDERFEGMMKSQFADHKFIKTDIVCF